MNNDQEMTDFVEDVRNYINGHPAFIRQDADDAYSWLLYLGQDVSDQAQALLNQ